MSIYRLIEQKLEETKTTYSAELDGFSDDVIAGSSFMIYALNSIFYDQDFVNIENGIVDSAYRKENHDYGIDAIYISANKTFITSIEQLEAFNEDTKFTIHVLQFKKGKGVDQAELLKFKEGAKKVIVEENIEQDKNEYLFNYMTDINEIKAYLYDNFSSSNIMMKCYVCFGGIKSNIESNDLLMTQVNETLQELSNGGYTTNCIEIIDAERLLELNRKGSEITDIIQYQKTFKYITETTGAQKLNGHISVVKGEEIANLVKNYQTSLFEANIRDYYRNSELNSKILDTCSSEIESKYFWSFNNGLTLTCRKVEELPGDKFRLHGIQIVNGCQTSNSLYTAVLNKERIAEFELITSGGGTLSSRQQKEYDKIKDKTIKDDVSVLIKVIETNDPDLIYRITETTNSQTPIKTFSLKANDTIQSLIEDYLEHNGVYYERRINFWKNQGKRNLVSIQHLFQVYESQVSFKPSQVKTRPKALFNTNYDSVFPDPEVIQQDFNLYLVPIKVDQAVIKKSRIIQRQKLEADEYKRMLISHGKFHLGVFILHSILGKGYGKGDIVKKSAHVMTEIEDTKFDYHYDRALENLKKVVQNFAGRNKNAIPAALKKNDLDARIVRYINRN